MAAESPRDGGPRKPGGDGPEEQRVPGSPEAAPEAREDSPSSAPDAHDALTAGDTASPAATEVVPHGAAPARPGTKSAGEEGATRVAPAANGEPPANAEPPATNEPPATPDAPGASGEPPPVEQPARKTLPTPAVWGQPVRERSLIGLVLTICGGTALLVAAMFTILLVSAVRQRDENASARRASDLLQEASTVERSLVDMETGLQGYVLTHEKAFLSPYTQARRRLPGQLSELRNLAEGSYEHRQVSVIRSSIGGYIRHYALPLIATRGHLSDGEAVSSTARGKQLIDAMRSQFTGLDNSELALRDRRRAKANAETDSAIAIAAVGLVGSLVMLISLGLYLIWRFLRPARMVAQAAGRLAAGDLDARVPEIGMGEIAMLGEAFNAMATTLQSRERELVKTHRQLERALAQAHEASAMKSNFLANMSHEIRTPLNGVIGMMDLLSETQLSLEQYEYVTVARASGEALMTVVNDVLDLAKIEAGRLDLEERDFDLGDLVESACDMVAATTMAKGIELQSFVHDDVPAVVRGDRMRVGQILANLMSNAVKFTSEGEVVIEVATVARRKSKAEIRFEVRDTGIGIPADRVAQLFDPFTQAEAGTTRTYGGTGLGLTIVRELTSMMGGRVRVESEPGRGSTFTCVIPFEVARDAQRPSLAKEELSGLRVLIVDDNATNRKIFEAYASSWGMRPELATDPASALAKLERAAEQREPFDVALLDVNMPEMSGIELADRMEASPVLRGTRVILLTSSPHALDYPARGIGYVLTKPVRQSRLLDAIWSVMSDDQRHLEEELDVEPLPYATGGSAGTTGRAKVLVAEDQRVNWTMVERMLTKRGHLAVNAANGEQALEMLERDQYDLVLMDCQMPVLDGYAATRELRRREAESEADRTPVVAMTANAMAGDRELCLAAGMDDYLAKPITSLAIDKMLERWVPEALGEPPAGGGFPLRRKTILDPQRINELLDLFPGEESAELAVNLRSEVEQQLERLDAALGEGRGAEAAEAAHRILSSARMIGAAALVESASELQACAEHDLERAQRVARLLRMRWVSATAALEAALAPNS